MHGAEANERLASPRDAGDENEPPSLRCRGLMDDAGHLVDRRIGLARGSPHASDASGREQLPSGLDE